MNFLEGCRILSDNEARKVIESPNNLKLLIKGPTGCGKTTVLLERYRFMVEQLHIPSDNILVLLSNKAQQTLWNTESKFDASGVLWQSTYYSFIQNELKICYPLVLKNCSEIANRSIKPLFLNFETTRYLLSKVIEKQRESKGAFEGMASNSGRIAADLAANLANAATSGIPYNEIGERLYKAVQIKNEARKKACHDADDILTAYRKRCFELGIFDFGMSVDLYCNCLLKDESYKNNLIKRVRHLLVDNVEECVNSEIELIELLLPEVKSCIMSYNIENEDIAASGISNGYILPKVEKLCDVVGFEKSYTCDDTLAAFSDMLFSNINNPSGKKPDFQVSIERNTAVELRSEMLEKTGERIIKLICEEGYDPSDIAVISTYADPVTELVIAKVVEEAGFKLKNISRSSSISENRLSKAMITLALLCHPGYHLAPVRDELKGLLSVLFGLDPVRCSILAGMMLKNGDMPCADEPEVLQLTGDENFDKYKYITSWINHYKATENPIPIDEFLQKAFLEVFITRTLSEEDIFQSKKLIEDAGSFGDIVSRFGMNGSKSFLDMAAGGLKSTGNVYEPGYSSCGEVILATPQTYLSASLNKKVVILTSLSSKNWAPRRVKEIRNPSVLSRNWEENQVYSEELETESQRNYLASLLRAMLKRCSEKIITFESNLSANGYENDGILAEYFNEILP